MSCWLYVWGVAAVAFGLGFLMSSAFAVGAADDATHERMMAALEEEPEE